MHAAQDYGVRVFAGLKECARNTSPSVERLRKALRTGPELLNALVCLQMSHLRIVSFSRGQPTNHSAIPSESSRHGRWGFVSTLRVLEYGGSGIGGEYQDRTLVSIFDQINCSCGASLGRSFCKLSQATLVPNLRPLFLFFSFVVTVRDDSICRYGWVWEERDCTTKPFGGYTHSCYHRD